MVMQTDVKEKRKSIRPKKKRLDVIETVSVYIAVVGDGFKRRFRVRISETPVVEEKTNKMKES